MNNHLPKKSVTLMINHTPGYVDLGGKDNRHTDALTNKMVSDTYESPVRVILLAYQRCGSSYVGQIFNQNPEAMYVFEPLDSLYVSMYGTQPGWNVPSDITHHSDGRARALPNREHEYVTRTLHALLTCDVESLPAEYFTHTFWRQFPASLKSLEAFGGCLRKANANITACGSRIRNHCPGRFGEDEVKLTRCHDYLQHRRSDDPDLLKVVEAYQNCTRLERSKVEHCIDHMTIKCRSSTIRSTKTVRLTMDTVEHLLALDPHLKVVHLLRDPRPVALSRLSMPSFRGHYSGDDMVLEAKLYCDTAVRDIHVRKQLERRGYGRTFMTVVYEEFVSNPLTAAMNVYEFLGQSFPEEVGFWLMLKKNKNSTSIATSWRNKLTVKQSEAIKDVCADLLQEMDDVLH